jgi:hypothetical protein
MRRGREGSWGSCELGRDETRRELARGLTRESRTYADHRALVYVCSLVCLQLPSARRCLTTGLSRSRFVRSPCPHLLPRPAVVRAHPCLSCLAYLQELTYIIKQDISDLNSQIASLQHLTKASGGQAPSKKAGSSKQVEEHNSNVVMLLQSKLANMGMGFKDVLEIRTQVSETVGGESEVPAGRQRSVGGA